MHLKNLSLKKIGKLLFLIGSFFIWIASEAKLVLPYRVGTYAECTRVTLTTDQKPEIKRVAENKWQIIFSEEIVLQPNKIALNTLIKNIEKKGNLLFLEYKQPIELKYFYLSEPNRLVLDASFHDLLGELINKKLNPTPVIQPLTKGHIIANKVEKKCNKFLVILDAGHGGKDLGAVGVRGTLEKKINLQIVKKIAHYLEKDQDILVFLTRNGDYYLPLQERLNIARKHRSDLFISIHADAYYNRQANGASVFALSPKGATSASARWLARKENESELGKELASKDFLVKSVLLDLAQTATIKNSLKIGQIILERLKKVTNLHSSIVEQAAFLVLKAPEIPSLLIEVGFVSNWEEEKKLLNETYQERLAFQIARGIVDYARSQN